MSNILHALLLVEKNKVVNIPGFVFPIMADAVGEGFERAIKKADIVNLRFHDLRHTFATRPVQNGIDLFRVKELMGHKSITMAMRYAHRCADSLRDSLKVLDSFYNSVTMGVFEKLKDEAIPLMRQFLYRPAYLSVDLRIYL
jgi:integrase